MSDYLIILIISATLLLILKVIEPAIDKLVKKYIPPMFSKTKVETKITIVDEISPELKRLREKGESWKKKINGEFR